MLALPEEKGKKHAIGNIALFVEPLSTWTEVFLPSPWMGEGEGGGEACARPHSRPRLPPHPDRSPRLRRRRGASLTAPLPPPGGKERQACTKIYVPVLMYQDRKQARCPWRESCAKALPWRTGNGFWVAISPGFRVREEEAAEQIYPSANTVSDIITRRSKCPLP